MSSFDPTAVRKAVEEFTPRRPQKFQDLLPAKDVVMELRHKRASYRSIADLLSQHCLPTSKTAIAVFCHQVLGETVRPRKRPGRKRPPAPTSANGGETTTDAVPAAEVGQSAEMPTATNGNDALPPRTRGPRRASSSCSIRFAKRGLNHFNSVLEFFTGRVWGKVPWIAMHGQIQPVFALLTRSRGPETAQPFEHSCIFTSDNRTQHLN